MPSLRHYQPPVLPEMTKFLCKVCDHPQKEHYIHKYTKNPICRYCGVAPDGSTYHKFIFDNLEYLEDKYDQASNNRS